jgi:3-hydroxyisobutyrate dehydrogenase-like beta-hydroxyacid dehydrogenase
MSAAAAAARALRRVGFVGANGLMGHGMAKNLQAKGFPTTLLTRPSPGWGPRVADLRAAGAAEVSSGEELAAGADVVLLCVTGSAAVDEVLFGARGVAAGARRGLIVVDSSTSDAAASSRVRATLAGAGVTFVDAPLTRTPAAAEAGTANTMVGADAATFAALRPMFAAYCEHIVHAGPPGSGLVLKLINNMVGQAITTATAEGLAVAAKSGLDLHALHKLMSLGSVNNLMFQFMLGTMLEGGPGRLDGLKFSLSNASKDLRAYTAMAADLGVAAPVGAAVHQALVQANALGLGDKFIASLITAQEKLAGVTIVPKDGK